MVCTEFRRTLVFCSLGLIVLCGQPIASAQRREPAAANKTQSPTNKWALLIGVNDYVHGKNLKYAVNDQLIFSKRLVESGFSGQHIFSLLSGAKNAKDQPVKRNIEIRLQTVTELADEGDFILVAFSGHGVHVNGESYICPADADPKSPKTTLIKVTDIYKALNKSKATVKLIVVDACRTETEELLPAETRSFVDRNKSLQGIAKTFASPPRGILVLSSSAVGQYSIEDPKLKQGVFMAFLQYGLTGVADKENGNRDGQLSLLELYQYAHENTKRFAKAHGTLQTPSLHGEIVGDFVLRWFPYFDLPIGKVAPEISGVDVFGRKFNLSDYRGKVVVVYFWGDWNPFCRRMYPQWRSLVKRLENKPFALIGVAGEKKTRLRTAIQANNITWPTFWDGATTSGPIAKAWGIRGWPTIYVLDDRGVVRYRGFAGVLPDAAVDQQLRRLVPGN